MNKKIDGFFGLDRMENPLGRASNRKPKHNIYFISMEINISLEEMSEVHRSILEPSLTDHFASDIQAFLKLSREESQGIAVQKLKSIWWEEDGLFLVIKQAEKLCGAIIAGQSEAKEQIVLYELFILPDCRNQKIGTIALEMFQTKVQKMGYQQIALSVMANNSNALKLYTGMGFETLSHLMVKDI